MAAVVLPTSPVENLNKASYYHIRPTERVFIKPCIIGHQLNVTESTAAVQGEENVCERLLEDVCMTAIDRAKEAMRVAGKLDLQARKEGTS